MFRRAADFTIGKRNSSVPVVIDNPNVRLEYEAVSENQAVQALALLLKARKKSWLNEKLQLRLISAAKKI